MKCLDLSNDVIQHFKEGENEVGEMRRRVTEEGCGGGGVMA